MISKLRTAVWLDHVAPLVSIILAVSMLVLTPFWAVEWLNEPFLGLLLEPNNVVSQINGTNWPARQMGVEWSDRLVSINNLEVENTRQISAVMAQNGFKPVEVVFAHIDGELFTLTIEPVNVPSSDFVSLFVIPYLVGLTFLGIGVWAYILESGQRSSRALVVFSSAVSLVTTTFLDMNTSHHVILIWGLSLLLGAGALVHLAIVFPQPMPFVRRRPASRYLHWLVAVLLAVPVAREIVAPTSPYQYIETWKSAYAYSIFSIAVIIGTLVVRIFRSHSAVIRQQSRVIVFGAILALGPIALFYLLPTAFSPEIPEFRAAIYFPLLIILPLSISYSILRYRLLDVDRIFSRATTYLLTAAAGLAAFYGLVGLISFIVSETIHPSDPLVIGLYLLLLVLGLIPLRDAIQRTINRVFYRAPADYQRILVNLSNSLVVTPNLDRTLNLLETEISNGLNPEKFVIFLFDDDAGLYQPFTTARGRTRKLPADDPLATMLHKATSPIWLPPNVQRPQELSESRVFEELSCEVFVPLHYEGKLTGFFALGALRSGAPYSSEDLDFLSAVAGQSTLALENARLFGNLSRTLDQTREMKNLMDDIFSSVATGIITMDVKRKITLFNRAAEEILGISFERVMGRKLKDAIPELHTELESVAIDVIEHGETTTTEIESILPPRGELYLRLSCSPLLDAYEVTKGATMVFEDLTEQRKLEAEQERIRQTFGRVVAPRVRDRLLADPGNLRLDGTEQNITLLFADLSGFTPFSERTPAHETFKILNYYLSLAAQAILEEEGTLDKFMGDAVMAMWNSPDPQNDHALRAVRAAISVIQRSIQAHSHIENPNYHLNFRIGITTGPAMVGNVGTSELFNYTAIGDTVNLAQRLEVAALPGQVLLQKSTYDLVSEYVDANLLAPIRVKGREQAVQVYELMGLKGS